MSASKIATINKNGLEQIKTALNTHGKLHISEFHRPDEVLQQYVWHAENQFEEGNGCAFEISARDTLTGRPKTVVITPNGYDIQENDV